MEGDFSFELQEGTDMMVFYSLKASQSTAATDIETVSVKLCMQLTQHWGSCQRWRLCVQSGTGLGAAGQLCWRGDSL